MSMSLLNKEDGRDWNCFTKCLTYGRVIESYQLPIANYLIAIAKYATPFPFKPQKALLVQSSLREEEKKGGLRG